MKCWAGCIISRNQDFQEKYQQPQLCRSQYSNGKSVEELKSLLKKVKDESEKAGLKLNIKNIMITASFIITSWQMEGEKVEERTNFISSDSKITMDGNCSHKIKTLASWKENYDKHRQHIKNQRHHFANKSLYIQNMAFPIVIYRWESWTIKKAECQIIDAFEMWYWRRLLRVSWTARRSNQFILRKSTPNIHWKDWCWNWSSNNLSTCCEEQTYWKNILILGKVKGKGEGGGRGWDG